MRAHLETGMVACLPVLLYAQNAVFEVNMCVQMVVVGSVAMFYIFEMLTVDLHGGTMSSQIRPYVGMRTIYSSQHERKNARVEPAQWRGRQRLEHQEA